jgi:DNA helicase II / ATP-dependent DNA helicase PcrA
VTGLLGTSVTALWSGTFHSVGNRILRAHATRLGFGEDYTIVDSEDAKTLMNDALARLYPQKDFRLPKGAVLARILSVCLNTSRSVDEVLLERYPHFQGVADIIRKVFQLYQTRKLEMGLMDFDDLLWLWRQLLVEHDVVRDQLGRQFEHVLVDEYQDTNHIQGEIVDLMVQGHKNLMVVGDDCQSIYRFRGAEYQNILGFPSRYANCRTFRLEENYRSTPEILLLTNLSIRNNRNQFPKTLSATRSSGPPPALLRLKDVHQQADFVCQRILELHDEGLRLNDIAILYRAHYQAMELQIEMTKRGIPFVVRSGVRFFEQAHIKDVLAYLRLVHNPRDELSFMRIAHHAPAIGTRRARQIWEASGAGKRGFQALFESEIELPKRARQSWKRTQDLFASLHKLGSPSHMIDTVLEGRYAEFLEQNYDRSENRSADLEQLAHYAGQFPDTTGFLGELSLLSGVSGQEIGDQTVAKDEYVCLSSVHQAKGLEWPAVFVVWLSDGNFPSQYANHSVEDLEEERRLFYVATTRARDELYLCTVLTHMDRSHRLTVLRDSLFVEELRPNAPWEEWEIVV